jgi:rhodanese-related sulfurtransferase
MQGVTWAAILVLTGLAPLWSSIARADPVNITRYRPSFNVVVGGKTIRIERIQDNNHHLTGGFTKTSRPCPPFCIHAMEAAPGVRTLGELELFEFMEKREQRGEGVLVDARTPSWYKKATIPGSTNIPFTVFADPDPNNPELWKTLVSLGVKKKPEHSGSFAEGLGSVLSFFGGDAPEESEVFDFSEAKHLALFCNGPWCDQSPRAIRGLRRMGYPADKLFYYRGGMQMWLLLGLTTVSGE